MEYAIGATIGVVVGAAGMLLWLAYTCDGELMVTQAELDALAKRHEALKAVNADAAEALGRANDRAEAARSEYEMAKGLWRTRERQLEADKLALEGALKSCKDTLGMIHEMTGA